MSLSDKTKADRKADANAGGSELFKGEKVRDITECTSCSIPRTISSKHALHNRKPKLSWKEKTKLQNQLEKFKETYVCGYPCPINGFETKRGIRCGDFLRYSISLLLRVSMTGRLTFVATVATVTTSLPLTKWKTNIILVGNNLAPTQVLCIAEYPATDDKCIHKVYWEECPKENGKEAKERQCSGYWTQEDPVERERNEVVLGQIQLKIVWMVR